MCQQHFCKRSVDVHSTPKATSCACAAIRRFCSTATDNLTQSHRNNFEPAAINLGGIALIGDCAMGKSNLRERNAFHDLRERNAFYEWTITADETARRAARALRICVGNELRKMYGDVSNEPIPAKIANLLHRLDQ